MLPFLETLWILAVPQNFPGDDHGDEHVSEKDFKINGNGFRGNNKKRKVADALLIREIKPTLNIQDQSVPLQLIS